MRSVPTGRRPTSPANSSPRSEQQAEDERTLAEGIGFAEVPAFGARLVDAGGQTRDDVTVSGGLVEAGDQHALMVIATPEPGTAVSAGDTVMMDLPGALAESNAGAIAADIAFMQALPPQDDAETTGDGTDPVAMLGERMAARSLQFLEVDAGDRSVAPIYAGQIGSVDATAAAANASPVARGPTVSLARTGGQALAQASGVLGMPAKSKPMFDGLKDGLGDCDSWGLDCVKQHFEEFGDGAEESLELIEDNLEPEPDPEPDPDPEPRPDPDCLAPCGGPSGDPHVDTFDGYDYDFQAVGEFVLAETDGLEVQARFEPLGDRRTVSVTTGIAVGAGEQRVTVLATPRGDAPEIRIDGEERSVDELRTPVDLDGTEVKVRLSSLQITSSDGHLVSVHRLTSPSFNVRVTSADESAAWTGLIGDADGDPGNDLRVRGGEPLPTDPDPDELYGDFGDSWRISDADSLFDYAPGESTATFTDRSFPDEIVTIDTLSEEQRAAAEAVCRAAGIIDPGVLDDCILDYAMTGDISFVQGAQHLDAVAGVRDGRIDPDDATTAFVGPDGAPQPLGESPGEPQPTGTSQTASTCGEGLPIGDVPPTAERLEEAIGDVDGDDLPDQLITFSMDAGDQPTYYLRVHTADGYRDEVVLDHAGPVGEVRPLGAANIGADRQVAFVVEAVGASRANVSLWALHEFPDRACALGRVTIPDPSVAPLFPIGGTARSASGLACRDADGDGADELVVQRVEYDDDGNATWTEEVWTWTGGVGELTFVSRQTIEDPGDRELGLDCPGVEQP